MFFEGSAASPPDEKWTDNVLANPAEDLLNHYVTWKLLVNASLDVDSLLDYFYQHFFGPAEIPMKNFFTLIENRWSYPARWDPVNKSKNISWKIMGTPEVLSEAKSYIEQAKQLATDEPSGSKPQVAKCIIYCKVQRLNRIGR